MVYNGFARFTLTQYLPPSRNELVGSYITTKNNIYTMDFKDDQTLCKVFIGRGRFQIIYYLIFSV